MTEQNEIKKAGLKITLPRLSVLQVLKQNADGHLSAEDIYRQLLDDGSDFGLATIYRVLSQFEDGGIIDRHSFAAGKSVFEMSDTLHHDHLMCIRCGRVIEFNDELIEQHQEEVAQRFGMVLKHHSHYLYGYCEAMCKGDE